jgi:hypothetical protein
MSIVSEASLWQLFKHLSQWLGNLSRAKQQRQRESIEALRAVIVAARHTQAYLRQLDDTGQQDHATEAKLASLWTELGFRLGDLGLSKLAKRCDIRGRYWANPDTLDKDFLKRADIGLERVEQMALQLLAEIEPARNRSRKTGPKNR